MSDAYDLRRFIEAQQQIYDTVCAELRAGRKRSHWMWFIFPQLKGLGFSETARRYAIDSLDEARAYLAHPLLGARLRECSRIVANLEGTSAHEIFGYTDELKFRSSMTLFAQAASDGDNAVFNECLRKYFGGKPDPATLARL